MKVNLETAKDMDLVKTFGQMVKYVRVSGNKIL